MGILSRFLIPQKRAHSGQHIDWGAWWRAGLRTNAGVDVTVDGALALPAVYACVLAISETIATLPLIVYRRLDRGKERVPELPLYRLLHDAPNPEMTAADYRATIFSHVLTWGNAYSEIERNGAGMPIALWPLRPDKMEVYRRNGELWYRYTLPDGGQTIFARREIHHLRGLGSNGIIGYSPIRMAMQAIGLGLATEEFGARFFSNGARPGVVYKHPSVLSDEAYGRLKASLESDHGGLSNAHRIKILEEGMDIATIGIPPEEAQFLSTREFQVLEIARIYRVPPHMIGDLSRATFSNIEEMGINFVAYTLQPWLVRHEQAISRDLISTEQRGSIFAEYLVDGLLRGNIQARYTAYSIGIQNGWLNRNEVRELENMNPADGLDEYLVPLNMMPAGMAFAGPQPGQDEAPEAESESEEDTRAHPHTCTCARESRAVGQEQRAVDTLRSNRQALINRNVRLWEDATRRLVKREVADLRRAIKRFLGQRDNTEFLTWLRGFYNELRGVIPDYYRALMLTYAEQIAADVANELGADIEPGEELEQFVFEYLENLAGLYVASSERQLTALLEESGGDAEEAERLITERLDGWEETRPSKFGFGQAFEAGNALAVAVYGFAGVQSLRWAARGESCPFCRKMDGKRIPINGAFVEPGQTVEGGDDDEPMLVRRKLRHGPLHGGCDCVVVAG